MGALNRVGVFARERGNAAQVLQQIEDYALATEQHTRVVADDRQYLPRMRAHAVEHFRMADDFKARLRLGPRVEPRVNLKKARDSAEPGNDQLFARDHGTSSAQTGIDGQMRSRVAGSAVLLQGLLQQCVDFVALPIHKAASSC